MSNPSEKSVNANGHSASVSHDTREQPGQEWHPAESDNVISLTLRADGQERASAERHAVENDQDALQSPYVAKKEPAQAIVKGGGAQDAAHRTSRDSREHLERRANDLHEPSIFSHGARQELARLAVSVRSIQDEAAMPLPRAPQLASAPGLSLVDNGFRPPRSLDPKDLALSPLMRLRPDNVRGPLATIKIITLIVSMFAVPAAYYFWVGGWDPISNPPPAMAPLISNSMVAPPKPSTQAAATSVQDDDAGTPAKDEPEAAKSFARESMAIVQPGTPGAQDPPSSTAVRQLDPEHIKLLIKQGEQFIAAGDMVTARLSFQRAAEAGDANAALALGATYDPRVLARFGVVGINADVGEARSWYRKAEKLGAPEARQRLELLADR